MARKILLADDSVTAQNMGRKILADAGYEVVAVNNGSAALKRISEQKPDLIVLDVYMPGYSGLEVCERLKETHETARIPILLTVGKLEPFKPEEAKRVRADGFIVKPFEASELLSALTKLEDKIVPHSEGSKPGRFARAIAAVEEGRYDKTVAADEDSGWKSRISFPSRKKAKKQPEPEDAEDPAIYNPVNKDLRTVAERPSPKPQPTKAEAEDNRVDLGALAPEGLPKDVTPEEIAALAAAAARMTGTVAETKIDEIKGGDAKAPEAAPEPSLSAPADPKTAEAAGEVKAEVPAEAKAETKVEAKLEAPVETKTETKTEAQSEAKTETKSETKSEAAAETQPSAEPPASTFAPSGAAQEEAAPATAAKEAALETVPAPSSAHEPSRSRETSDEPVTMAVAAGAESAWAPSRWTAIAATLSAEEASLSLESEMQKASAAFAAAEAAETKSTAVPQPAPPASEPAPEAPAAATTSATETASAEPAKIEPAKIEPASIETASIEPAKIELEKIEPEKIEPEKPETANVESDVAPVPALAEPAVPAPVVEPSPGSAAEATISEVASIATEAIHAAVKEFEKVASSQIETAPAPSEPAHVPTVPKPADEAVAQTFAITEAKAEETPMVNAATEAEPPKQERAPAPAAQEKSAAEFPVSAPKYESKDEPSYQAEHYQPEQSHTESEKVQEKAEEPAPVTPAAEDRGAATTLSAKLEEIRDEVTAGETSPEAVTPAPAGSSPAPESTVADSVAAAAAAAQAYIARVRAAETASAPTDNPIAGGTDDMAKKESETAATAAGAWASWRRIRDVGHKSTTPSPDSGKGQVSAKEAAFEREEASDKDQDNAAMAVAAGAEKAPEEVTPASESDSGEIASIVDSVLADLRPKIVEEISKKLGKKK